MRGSATEVLWWPFAPSQFVFPANNTLAGESGLASPHLKSNLEFAI
jgi:hypothetical protein